ncbi:hypothetical protein CC80DRAFT_510146 [Byssothecium circinans]|uniref:RING-type domain-containing protein n=1 Tax=Byssothecium circinans TaxID=147558 RepID=A0A6A5TCE3_9PLEO|nr:hypothetical protein CC80DRAFT_510146 [Byssothecium circinans]
MPTPPTSLTPEHERSLAEFIENHLAEVPPSRPYVLDKPCVLCCSPTNIRVNLPYCKHRVCSRCLAEIEVYKSPVCRMECMSCLAYWFTVTKSNGGQRSLVTWKASTKIAERCSGIEKKICGTGNKTLVDQSMSSHDGRDQAHTVSTGEAQQTRARTLRTNTPSTLYGSALYKKTILRKKDHPQRMNKLNRKHVIRAMAFIMLFFTVEIVAAVLQA